MTNQDIYEIVVGLEVHAQCENVSLISVSSSLVQFKFAVVLRKALCRIVVGLNAAERFTEDVKGVESSELAEASRRR